MRKIFLRLFVLFFVQMTFSQNLDIAYPHVVPMSPNASELAKYADCSVSYYTGTPNINIPLYEIDLDGFKLPISLNYHASGIRVDQEATWVGLGWSLDVGSRISRTVNGTDDFLLGEIDPNYPFVNMGYYDAPEQNSILQTHFYPPYVYSDPYITPHNLIFDSEPDIFYYNIAGMNGKFILDKSRGAVLFDKSHNLKIEIIRNLGSVAGQTNSVKFKITDKEGNQYFYNQWETTKNYSENGFLNRNLQIGGLTVYDDDALNFQAWYREETDGDLGAFQASPYEMRTSWCLSKIITSHGREIDFTYDTELEKLPTQESCENYWRNNSSYLYYYKSKVVNMALRLNKIEGDFGRVEFMCSDRNDIKGTSKKLDSIAIYNNKNALIKSFGFDYSYFNDDYSGNPIYAHVFKRLKLNSLTEFSNANLPLNGGYHFDYFEGNFPPKNSKDVDYWGFQNGKTYGANYYIGLKHEGVNFPGVKKDMNFNKAIIGTLKKIMYPTGGTAEYKFESNTIQSGFFETNTYEPMSAINSNTVDLPVYNNVNNVYDEYPSQNTYVFDIQQQTTIKITCDLENTNEVPDYDFNYNNSTNPLGKLRKISPTSSIIYNQVCPYIYGSSYNIPYGPYGQGNEITLTQQVYTLEAGTYEFIANTPPKDVLANWRLLFQSNFITPGSTYEAGGIRIKEITTDAKTRRFNYPCGTMLVEPVLCHNMTRDGVPDPWPTTPCITQVSESKAPLTTLNSGNFVGYDWVEEYLTDVTGDVSKSRYNFHNNPETDIIDADYPDSPRYLKYTNGLIESIEKYRNNTIVEKEEYKYTSTYSNNIKAFKDKGYAILIETLSLGLLRKLLEYYYRIEWPLKSKVIKTIKTDNGEDVISETNYSYNSKDLLKSTSSIVNNSTLIEELKYPFDYSDAVSRDMVAKNMIGIPITKTTLRGVENLSKQETVYHVFANDIIAPEFIKTSKGIAPTENRLHYSNYDEKGNLLEVQQEDNIKVSYIWGYNKTLPVAKLENIAYNNIPTTLITSIQLVTDSATGTEAQLITALNGLRSSTDVNMVKAMITTYTYKPLVGLTTLTDPKGETQTYTYDSFGRLRYVKDKDGNILNENEYHYRP